jgi:AcrR family transcriptional regulator
MSRTKQRALIPRKRQERGARRVEAIVGAAAGLFALRGFDGTSMNSIAKESGLTIGSLYQYFPSRDAIVDAVAEWYLRTLRAQKAEFAALRPATVREMLRNAIVGQFDFYARYAGVKAFLDADPSRAASIRAVQREVAIFVPVFAQFYPAVADEELARVAFICSTIVRGSAVPLSTPDHAPDREMLVDEIVCACAAYVIARLGEPRESPGA